MKKNRTLSLAAQREKAKRELARRKENREARHPKPRLVRAQSEDSKDEVDDRK